MKWEDRGKSRNVSDNRGRRSGGSGGRGVGGLASLGVGGFLIVLVLSLVTGVDLFGLLGIQSPLSQGGTTQTQTQSQNQPQSQSQNAGSPADRQLVGFVSAVLDDSQATWAAIFRENNIACKEAQLSLESGLVPSACGSVPASAGPFYCPLDETIYLNFAFFNDLQTRYGASGDFAQAYVIAHELGHHVQNLLGTSSEVRQQQQANPRQANRLSVALELQADCYAGIWGGAQTQAKANPSDQLYGITQADFEEGITAAAAIGDDRLQKEATGRVNPEAFTHGSSEQRVNWFSRGFRSGNPAQCDTFASL